MTNSNEHIPEQFPGREELRSVFEQLLNGREYTVVGEPSDDHYVIETKDYDGQKMEYQYAKANYDWERGSLPSKARYSASIHTVFYNGDIPQPGECVANYRNGQWEFLA